MLKDSAALCEKARCMCKTTTAPGRQHQQHEMRCALKGLPSSRCTFGNALSHSPTGDVRWAKELGILRWPRRMRCRKRGGKGHNHMNEIPIPRLRRSVVWMASLGAGPPKDPWKPTAPPLCRIAAARPRPIPVPWISCLCWMPRRSSNGILQRATRAHSLAEEKL